MLVIKVRRDSLPGVTGRGVLRRHVGHCVAKVTPYGTVITKAHPDSPRKIDVAVAAVIAYERATTASMYAPFVLV